MGPPVDSSCKVVLLLIFFIQLNKIAFFFQRVFFIAMVVITVCLSFVFSLAIESPIIALESMIFKN